MSSSPSSTRLSQGEPEGPSGNPAREELDNSSFVLSASIVWIFAVVALTFPFWPIYFASIGLEESQISLLLGVGPFAALFANQIWGYLADEVFNIRVVMILMSIGSAFFAAFFPFVVSFPFLLLLMAMFAFFTDARIALVNAMVLDNRDGERRYGIIRTTGSIAFILVSYSVAKVTDYLGDTTIIFPLIVVANVLAGLSMAPVKDYRFGERARLHGGKNRPSFLQTQRILLSFPVVRVFLIFLCLSQIPHSISHIMQTALIKSDMIGGTDSQAITPILVGAIAEIGIFLIFGRLLMTFRLMPMFFLAAAGQVLRWLLVFLYPTWPVIAASGALHALSYGLMHMCSIILINREIPARFRSSGQTLLNIVYMSVGMTLGPLLNSAYLAYGKHAGWEMPLLSWYGVAAGIVALSLPAWFVMMRMYNREHGVGGLFVRP